MKSKLEKAYLGIHFAGKSDAARLLDRMLFCIIIVFAVHVLTRSFLRSKTAAVFLSALAGVIFLLAADLIFRYRLARTVKELRQSASEKVFRRKLLLAETKELEEEIRTCLRPPQNCCIRVLQRIAPITDESVFEAVRNSGTIKSMILVSVSGFTQEAERLASQVTGMHIETLGTSDIPGLSAAYKPSEKEIDDEIISSFNCGKTRKAFTISKSIGIDRIEKYFLLSFALFLLSFISKSGLYLRILASFVVSIAVFAAGLGIYRKNSD